MFHVDALFLWQTKFAKKKKEILENVREICRDKL